MKQDKLQRFILASASPRRKELLQRIIPDFQVVKSGVDEATIKANSPNEFAKLAAIAKARAVAKTHSDTIVIGADTIVVLGDEILGKPRNNQEAVEMISALAGTTHKVMTGVAVIFPDQSIASAVAITKVTMRAVSAKEIQDYVGTGQSLDKAGGYGIQEIEDQFIDSIDGDFDNVVGLPVKLTKKLLETHFVI